MMNNATLSLYLDSALSHEHLSFELVDGIRHISSLLTLSAPPARPGVTAGTLDNR